MKEFGIAVRESGYKGQVLIKEFKRKINGVTRRKLIKCYIQLIFPQPVDWFSQTTHMYNIQKQQQTTEISGHQ